MRKIVRNLYPLHELREILKQLLIQISDEAQVDFDQLVFLDEMARIAIQEKVWFPSHFCVLIVLTVFFVSDTNAL